MKFSLVGVALFVFALSACGDPPPPTKASPLSSRVELAAGDVRLVTKEESKRLITGAMLPEEARIEVGDGGRALIKMGTGSAVFMRGGTKAWVKGEDIDLEVGELWVDIPEDEDKTAKLSAGDVVVSASGAGLDMAVADGKATVYVARGLAVVAAPGGRTEVQSGEQVAVKGKEPLEVEPVSFWEDWTGGMADRGLTNPSGAMAAGRIYGIDRDRPGSPPQELQINFQSVRVFVRDGVAHTTVDQRFFNPSSDEVEGWYWFTVPQGASVERFAWEVDGVLVDGEMIERKQAAATYEAAVRAKTFDPALLEWVNARTFRARIYPVPAAGEKRVVLSYTELLPLADGVYRYVYPMGGDDETRIQEFSLNVDLGEAGENMEISTLSDARVEEDRRSVSMRRSGFVPRSDFLLEMRPKEEDEPMRVMRFSTGKDEADYVMLRYSPEVEWQKVKEIRGDVVVVLDTSAGGDESERQVRADTVEAILRALSDGDRFAVMAADLTPRVLFPAEGMAPADESSVSQAVESLAEVPSAGATDLGSMFGAALELVHDAEQPAVVYVGDGLATVGETGADELTERLRRSLGGSRARLFTIAVGADADTSLLERLARVGGGKSFRIDNPEQLVQEALRFSGMVKTPTITELKVDAGTGLDQVFSTASGKVSEGEEVVILARTHHALPGEIKVTGRLGGEEINLSYDADVEKGAEYGYIPSLWARLYLERLLGEGREERRGSIIALGLNYGLMTPFTSFLVLENQQAYILQGIKKRQRYHQWSNLDVDLSGVKVAKAAAATPFMLFGCAEMKGEEMPFSITESQDKGPPPAAPAEPTSASTEQMDQLRSAIENMKKSGAADMEEASEAPMKESAKRRKSPARPAREMDEMDDLLGGAVAGPAKVEKPKMSPPSVTGKGGGGSVSGSKSLSSLVASKGTYGILGPKDNKPGLGTGWGAAFDLTNPYGTSSTKNQQPMFQKRACSDASKRPLWQRRLLWKGRLAKATGASDYFRIFKEAGERCELPRWKQRKVLLDLIENRAGSGDTVRGLLSVFSSYPSAQKYLRRKILRRSLDPDVTMGTYFTSGIDWRAIKRGLAALKTDEDRLKKIREILEGRPEDPVGRALLVEILVEAEQLEEAAAQASRLRRDGMAGPSTLALLCDLQAKEGLVEEARRTCSELVEFNSEDPVARRNLGDLFLRHGWYSDAYRQYKTLVEVFGENPISMLRMAAAAAGMGKVDEALRIERKVASGDGEPGPSDPRKWARLFSAVRLARMITDPKNANDEKKKKSLERALKRTQLFGTPVKLVVLVWEDLHTNLSLSAKVGEDDYVVSERVSAPGMGMDMIDLGVTSQAEPTISVDLKDDSSRHPVPYTIVRMSFDGKGFSFSTESSKATAEADE